jgi:pantetheine-phosphate adenylyltransferase
MAKAKLTRSKLSLVPATAQAASESAPQARAASVAVYPGTFDPITNGHLDILQRALRLFDTVIVTLAVNQRKAPLFSVDERIAFIRNALPSYQDRLEFQAFDGLLVDFCRAHNAGVIVRGLRALADFEYEFQFAHMNRRLAPDIDTMFFMTDERNHYVSSSLVKEVASLGGDITGLVPPAVVAALAEKFSLKGTSSGLPVDSHPTTRSSSPRRPRRRS